MWWHGGTPGERPRRAKPSKPSSCSQRHHGTGSIGSEEIASGPHDCLNRLEEDYNNPEGAEIIGYEEPDLSGANNGKFTSGTKRESDEFHIEMKEDLQIFYVPCYLNLVYYDGEMNEDATTQNQSYPSNGGVDGGYPTQVESDTNVRNTYGGATGEYTRWVDYDALNDQFVNTDFSLGSSSDSDYQPTGNLMFQELLQQNRVERPENQGVTLSDFQNTKPISFAYAPEPMDAEDWLMDTEQKLNTVGCNDQEKVRYATHLLCGPTASWWDNIVAVYPAEKVFTWEEFKRKFRESNVPESIVELNRREFESLEQRDKAILTYVREFSGLSRYAVEEVNTEDKKKKEEGHMLKDCPKKNNGGGQSGGGGSRGGNTGNWKNKKPFGKLHQLGGGG
ncbi:hypothetical protein QYE76_005433 [Lolium multiflorum]|uniref:Retrotransposon gag domain-containing protein n=1 Tax=Lolium multiflorum TaxID=4521 RepID=A0AAD8RTW2_LOLMU|nr:hypothetical protein QYE76_005433 [Lolium multiflorum]